MGLFKFRFELFQFMDKVCFFGQLRPSTKLMYKVMLVPYVLLQFALLYLIYTWWNHFRGNRRRGKQTTTPASSSSSTNHNATFSQTTPAQPIKTFLSKMATGFILSLLFTYQKLATTSFSLLNCVPVGDDLVLYIEGTVVCYRSWQYLVIAYVCICIGPFCLVLLIGPGLLKDGLIPLKQFFCACLLPLPFLVYWLSVRFRLKGQRPVRARSRGEQLSAEAQAVINVLQGPFKCTESRLLGPLCGAGVVIGRR